MIGSVQIHPSATVSKTAILNKQFRPLLKGKYHVSKQTILNAKVYVGHSTIIGAGSIIGANTIVDDFSVIESEVTIGKRTLLIYRTQICNGAEIGNNCVIGGFIGESTLVGDNCRIFGKVVHSQYNPLLEWDGKNSEEEAPVFEDFSFVGFGAIVAGGIKIGFKAYVLAGAIVTKNVPPLHIVSGINKMIHFSKWPGKLGKSEFFREKP